MASYSLADNTYECMVG